MYNINYVLIYVLFVFIRCVILDEADQMLERGFAETMDEILSIAFHKGCHCHMHFVLHIHIIFESYCYC